ncbi:exodeoxyribonuclease V subunit gamma [Thalassotalea mangrovi]|uniref:RecBCD enzyme subunit RecC n=1 Tax=Thalassotalea mangrovi TaxID=2572245 RepID=A0A4U1B429_9GAMM|nr:exodeoxyribonuclease V subunit gamma [Thalassotalea mangrovi]TKB44767.1 exodeoxyribonuclease V subunit gamma [Thalassotalea mangrovi]
MLYLYPANRMEDLLLLFAKVQQISPLPPLVEELVLVQNQGMQHWLNMQQASANRVSMNTRFSLPAQFFWKSLRTLCIDDLPEQSPYSRDVLAWRIELLLQSDTIIQEQSCQPLTTYWNSESAQQKDLRRYQLARKIADLYEQYLIYRPDWIHSWCVGEHVDFEDGAARETETWLALIWQQLHQQIPYDPQQLIRQAIANLADKAEHLPRRISLFGLNAIAPLWMEFLAALGEHIDIHFYQLNPCIEYWGDIKSEKSQAKQDFQQLLSGWPNVDDISNDVNPLLANLGQQGKDLLSQLQQFEHIEIPVYERLAESQLHSSNVLTQLQHDILSLEDRRGVFAAGQQQPLVDDSIVVTSAHSALREVQGLHDYLLHQFNNDPTLTPKDVLVMCPQVEDYAPYIDAVFVRGWEDIGENIPPLPCSIADRISKDSEPLVNGFNELLNLPDSRFEVSRLIAYLQLKPVQKRFNFNDSDIELISFWLQQANIHWGLDAEHKSRQIGIEDASDQFTWHLGLKRLLRGFAYSDQLTLAGDNLYLPWVEGDNSELLGKFLQFIEQLQLLHKNLHTSRSAGQWHEMLTEMLDSLFNEDESDPDLGLTIVRKAIDDFYEHCQQANYHARISLLPVREYLNTHFSEPDPGRQFMIGQITFCSMLPMRSIPFKLVAILGMNDGQFPRQRQPIGFDLMAMTAGRLGDRSLHKDDRYLFLEALISARSHLYISYQGRDIKNNGERQPSIVLRELMDYLEQGFGWRFSPEHQLRQLPMQSFANENYSPDNAWASFDGKWLNLAPANVKADTASDEPLIEIAANNLNENEGANDKSSDEISDEDLIQALRHPAKIFGTRQLNLTFAYQQEPLSDVEPFAPSGLEKFNYKQQILATTLQSADSSNPQLVDEITVKLDNIQRLSLLSGAFPDNHEMNSTLAGWRLMVEAFSTYVAGIIDARQLNGVAIELPFKVSVTTEENEELMISCSVPLLQHPESYSITYTKSASASDADLCRIYIGHLLACVYAKNQSREPNVITQGFYLNEKTLKVEQIQLTYWQDAEQRLQALMTGYQQLLRTPKPINMAIAKKHFWNRNKFQSGVMNQQDLEKLWYQEKYGQSMATDPYLQYFFKTCPQLQQMLPDLVALYQVFFERLSIKNVDLAVEQLSAADSAPEKE